MRSLTLGTIRGIDVKLHPSFALVGLWIAYRWGYEEGGNALALLYGTVLIACVFGFVLLHELGHSFMAQQFGIRVHDITLVPFGGVARVEQIPTQPSKEALVTIAGPAINVALAVALFPLMILSGVARGFDSAGDFVRDLDSVSFGSLITYLFMTNVVIFIFNMVPAFPMDGGRLLRAWLSTWAGRERATGVAICLGAVASLAMLVVGVWWRDFALPLIAVFMIVSAYGEGRMVRLEESMRRLQVGQFAVWDRGGVSASDPVTFALRGGLHDSAVTEGGKVIGMVWKNDLAGIVNGGSIHRTIGDVMDEDIVTVNIDDSVYDVQQLMQRLNRWAMPVVENGMYRGIFTADRFIHVYRYLIAQSPERRRLGEVAAVVMGLFRPTDR
jgi:Zn-dependent protease